MTGYVSQRRHTGRERNRLQADNATPDPPPRRRKARFIPLAHRRNMTPAAIAPHQRRRPESRQPPPPLPGPAQSQVVQMVKAGGVDPIQPLTQVSRQSIGLPRRCAQPGQHAHPPMPRQRRQILRIEHRLQRLRVIVGVGIGYPGLDHRADQRQQHLRRQLRRIQRQRHLAQQRGQRRIIGAVQADGNRLAAAPFRRRRRPMPATVGNNHPPESAVAPQRRGHRPAHRAAAQQQRRAGHPAPRRERRDDACTRRSRRLGAPMVGIRK